MYRDLLEVCEAQLQFGVQAHVPVFGGSRGPDVSKSISDIQVAACTASLHVAELRQNSLHLRTASAAQHIVQSRR